MIIKYIRLPEVYFEEHENPMDIKLFFIGFDSSNKESEKFYEIELSDVQEEYDNIIIRINERNTSTKGIMKFY